MITNNIDPRIRIVVKTADELVNNSVTLQNDDELFFAIGANQVWAVEIWLLVNSGTTPDIDVTIVVPSGGEIEWHVITDNASNALDAQFKNAAAEAALRGGGAAQFIGVLRGVVVNGSTAGNVQLQWAQATADVSDTKVLENSCIIRHRIR